MQNQVKQLVVEDIMNDISIIKIQDSPETRAIFHPSDLTLDKHNTSKEPIPFNVTIREQFFYMLQLLSSQDGISEAHRAEAQAALKDLTVFLKELVFEYEDGDEKGKLGLRYEIVDPKSVLFYPHTKDPDYVHYLQQLEVVEEYHRRDEPVPVTLQSYCEQAKARFFEGLENEQLRYQYMHQAVQHYLTVPSISLCAYNVIYKEKPFLPFLKKPKKNIKAKKAKAMIMPYLKAGHLVDQQLKYNYPPDKTGQISLFESLQDQTQRKISAAGVEQKTIIEGIRLTPSETKVIDSLCKLLNLKSQTIDPDAEDYFAGNIQIEHMMYGGKKTVKPKVLVSLHEITREYRGGDAPGGKEMANVKTILTGLEKKHFLIRYLQNSRLSNGNQRGQILESFQPLIRILKYIDAETDTSGQEVSRTEQMVVALNPIFADQIKSKFIEYPGDINRRTIIAYGSHNLSEAAIRLRDHLMREKSSKRFKPEMLQERLYYFLCEKWMQEGRRKKVIEYTEKALETVTALGLITKHEVVETRAGQGKKVIFHIDKDWK